MFNIWKYIYKDIIPLLPLFLLIYTSDDSIIFGMYGDVKFYYIKLVVWIAIIGFYVFKGRFLQKTCQIPFCITMLLYITSSIVTGFNIGFLYYLFIFLIALVYVSNNTFEEFKRHFCQIICFLALCSSFVYLANIIRPELFYSFPVLYNAADHPYTTVFMANIFHSLQLRNFGIFREPGMYMVYLNVALFFEWYSKYPNKFRVAVYIFTLLTTVSTAGIIIGALIISAGMFIKRNYSVIIVVIPILFLGYYFLMQEDSIYYILLFSKLEEGGSGTAIARIGSITVPLKIFLNYPLGAGPEKFNELFPVFCNQMYGEPLDPDLSTNTLTKLLAVYGPLLFLLFFIYLIRFVRISYKKGVHRLLFLLVLVLAMSNEDMRNSILYLIMLAYGASYCKTKKHENTTC